jgi:hypothetical protein
MVSTRDTQDNRLPLRRRLGRFEQGPEQFQSLGEMSDGAIAELRLACSRLRAGIGRLSAIPAPIVPLRGTAISLPCLPYSLQAAATVPCRCPASPGQAPHR